MIFLFTSTSVVIDNSNIYREVSDVWPSGSLSIHDTNTQNVWVPAESEYESQRWLNIHEFSNMNKFSDIALFLCVGLWCRERESSVNVPTSGNCGNSLTKSDGNSASTC